MSSFLADPISTPFIITNSNTESLDNLNISGDYPQSLEHLKRLREREAVNAMEHFIENESNYQRFAEKVSGQRKQMAKVCLQNAMEKTKEICDAMIRVMHDHYQREMVSLKAENKRLRQLNETMAGILNRADEDGSIDLKSLHSTHPVKMERIEAEYKSSTDTQTTQSSPNISNISNISNGSNGSNISNSNSLPVMPPLEIFETGNDENEFGNAMKFELSQATEPVKNIKPPEVPTELPLLLPVKFPDFNCNSLPLITPSLDTLPLPSLPTILGKRPRKRSRTQSNKTRKCGRRKRRRPEEYDDSYQVTVNCKECGQYFDNFDAYRAHLQKHFEDDPQRKWRVCPVKTEKGQCDLNKFWNSNDMFIAHLSSYHGYERPFRCPLVHGGKQCTYVSATKYSMRSHMVNCAKQTPETPQ